MNQDQSELTLEESIKQVMQTLPPIIRDYLSQGKYTAVARDMMAKYALRIDQGGVLEREIMLLLMGIENPDEFSKALVEEARLDQKTVNGIVQDINEQIFMPLREQMRNAPPTEVKPPQKPTQIPPQPSRPAQQPPRHQNIALRDALATITKKTPQPLDSGKLLEDHEEPSPSLKATEGTAHIEFNKAPAVPSVVMPPAPSKAPPPPILQKAVPPKPIVRAEPEDKLKPAAPSAPAKPYSIDPYREPVDEK
jgi:hypothetical protein